MAELENKAKDRSPSNLDPAQAGAARETASSAATSPSNPLSTFPASIVAALNFSSHRNSLFQYAVLGATLGASPKGKTWADYVKARQDDHKLPPLAPNVRDFLKSLQNTDSVQTGEAQETAPRTAPVPPNPLSSFPAGIVAALSPHRNSLFQYAVLGGVGRSPKGKTWADYVKAREDDQKLPPLAPDAQNSLKSLSNSDPAQKGAVRETAPSATTNPSTPLSTFPASILGALGFSSPRNSLLQYAVLGAASGASREQKTWADFIKARGDDQKLPPSAPDARNLSKRPPERSRPPSPVLPHISAKHEE